VSTVGRNTIYNLAGLGIPLVLFVATIPAYIALIGPARYGVLAIVWLVLGLFGMTDLGLGRAATQKIAALRDGRPEERRAALGSALAANLAIGAVGAVIMLVAAGYLFSRSLNLEPWLRAEALPLIPLMAAGVPLITTLGILSGALQGRERFFLTNRITIVNSALFQLAPLAVAVILGPTLWPLVVSALCARLVAVLLLWRECKKEFGPHPLKDARRQEMTAMLRYGGWITGAGLFGTVLVFSDRLLIGSLIGAVAVTIYAVPLDGTRRLAVIADSLANALFPRLAVSDADQSRAMLSSAGAILFAVVTPIAAVFIVVADPLFRLWLGDSIGGKSAPLAQILVIAGWVNVFAKSPYAMLQAQGRPQLIVILQLVQMPFYLLGLWWALRAYGLTGAAWVYLARNAIDTILINLAARGSIERGLLLAGTLASMIALVACLQVLPAYGALWSVLLAFPTGLLCVGLSWLVVRSQPFLGRLNPLPRRK